MHSKHTNEFSMYVGIPEQLHGYKLVGWYDGNTPHSPSLWPASTLFCALMSHLWSMSSLAMNRCPRLHAWCSGVKRFYKHRGREKGLQKQKWRVCVGVRIGMGARIGAWLRVRMGLRLGWRWGEERSILRTCERGDKVSRILFYTRPHTRNHTRNHTLILHETSHTTKVRPSRDQDEQRIGRDAFILSIYSNTCQYIPIHWNSHQSIYTPCRRPG